MNDRVGDDAVNEEDGRVIGRPLEGFSGGVVDQYGDWCEGARVPYPDCRWRGV